MICSLIEHGFLSVSSMVRKMLYSKAPVKRSQLFIQHRTTFVVKKTFVPFDHLVVCCCIMLHEVCSRSEMFVEQMLCDRTFLLFSVMLHVVAFVWPLSQTLLWSRLRSGTLISRNHRLCPLFTFNLYLSGFKSSSVKTSKQNLRKATQLYNVWSVWPLSERTTCNNMQQMINKCCVLSGKRFGSFDRGLKWIISVILFSFNHPV